MSIIEIVNRFGKWMRKRRVWLALHGQQKFILIVVVFLWG